MRCGSGLTALGTFQPGPVYCFVLTDRDQGQVEGRDGGVL